MEFEVGIKPYWIRVGAGGLLIADKSDLVRWFVEPTSENIAHFDFANQKNDFLCGLEGYARIPGDWPEPKDGAVWEHLVPFFPQQTICDPGKTEAKPWLYVVGEHEDPWDVAEKFGQPYKGWVQLRQANWDDDSGFARPAADAGLCSFMSWYPGKQVKIPASWPDPPKGSPVWKSILVPSAGHVGGSRGKEEMKTHKVGPADSVVGLAKRYGVSREALFAANPQIHVRTDRDGFRNFSPAEFHPGKEINIPSASGSVGEPSGAVGAPDDGTVAGCGTYGMDQFGGAVGFRKMVAKAAPKPVRAAAKPVMSVSWDATKPGTSVTYRQWWTYAIKEMVKYTAKNGAHTWSLRPPGPLNQGATSAYQACAEKIVEPGGSTWIQSFLSTFAGPSELVGQFNRPLNEHDTDPVIPQAIESQINPANLAERRAIKQATNAFVGSMYQQIGSLSGPYGMDQFGGAVGFRKMVAKAAPKPVMASKPRPVLTNTSPTWEGPEPTGQYANAAFWAVKILSMLQLRQKADFSGPAPLAQRIGNDTKGFTKIATWLMGTWTNPVVFVNALWDQAKWVPASPPNYNTFVWDAPQTNGVADRAASLYLQRACEGVGQGWYYNPWTGECSNEEALMQGAYGGETVEVNGQQVPFGTGAPTNFRRQAQPIRKKEYPQMSTAGAGGEVIITGGEGSVGWRPPWGSQRPRPWRPQPWHPRPPTTPMQPHWDSPMLPYTPLTAAQFWAQQMVMAWPSNYGNPPSVWGMQNWLKGVFTGGPWSMIQYVFQAAYHMAPPLPWATAYANPIHASDARAVAKQLALNYAFSGGAVSGPADGNVAGCGCGGTGGDGACSFTPAPNWSEDAEVPDNIGHMHTMMPNWGMRYAIDPNQYLVIQGQVGAAGDSCPMGYAEPAKGVKYLVQKEDVTNGPWWIANRFGEPNAHSTLRGANSETGSATEHSSGSCNLDLVAGQLINVPLAWFLGDAPLKWKDAANYLRKYNSASGKWDTPWSALDCPTGYVKDSTTGQCVVSTTPPGPGTTCLPGETYLPAANVCVPPSGIPPIAGSCPTGTYLDGETGMCKIGSGGTKVDVKEGTEEGWPLWVWGLLGAGAAGGILLIASAASKKKGAKKPPMGKPVPRTSASRQLTSARTSPRRSTRRPVEIIDTEGVTVR